MSKVLFFTWPGDGNQPPAIGLAQQLRRAGHDTLFAGYAGQAGRFEGLGFATLTRSGVPSEPFNPADLMGWLTRHIWACPHHVADVAEIVDQYQPDLVVVDCLMSGVLAALEAQRVPAAALVHSTPGALAPPGGPLDILVLPELNRIRCDLDLTAVDSWWQVWQQHGVLNATIPELDPLGAAAFDQATWIGPVFEDVTVPEWISKDEGDDRPLVLVSFSSGVAWDQTSRIQRTIDGLANADVRVLVTAGAVDPRSLKAPTTSTTVLPYYPHGSILPKASAVVTHAGHGTLTAALAHGLPVVAIPNDAADQPALAAQTEYLGAGIHLADEAASPRAIAAAVRTVLDDTTYAATARMLGDRIRSRREQPLDAVTRLLTRSPDRT